MQKTYQQKKPFFKFFVFLFFFLISMRFGFCQMRAGEGVFYAVGEKKYLSFAEGIKRIRAFPVVIIGEHHGYFPDQERERMFLERLLVYATDFTLFFEMLGEKEEHLLAQLREDFPEKVDLLGEKLTWRERGWPVFENYRPLFDLAFAAKIDIKGIDGVLPLLRSEQDDRRASWQKTIAEEMCGLGTVQDLNARAALQMRREAYMAEKLRAFFYAGQKRNKVPFSVVIVGQEHARKERGIPFLLKKNRIESVSIALLNVSSFKDIPKFSKILREEGMFDYLWIKKAQEIPSSCRILRAKGIL